MLVVIKVGDEPMKGQYTVPFALGMFEVFSQ